jgi:TonB-dependent starch-binding outer membrane protein SusC
MRKIALLLFAMLLVGGQLMAQNRTVSGTVTDEKGSPLAGVSVTAKGTKLGTTTGNDGSFTLSLPETTKSLTFSLIGFTAETVNIDGGSVSVKLKAEEAKLEEVIVVGYGTQKKKEVTGSVGQVKAADLANRPIQGPDQALRGQVAGVTVNQSSGTPGASMSVNIRGTGSISAGAQPLYVIDGIPLNTGSYAQVAVGGQTLNSLAQINPSDIESYEILKDAAASAIYGSRAANGVVLITTKRGANKKTKVSLNAYFGQSNVYKTLKPLTGPEYVALVQESVVNRFGTGIVPSQINLVGLDNAPNTYPNTNWQDLIFRDGPIRNYDVSVQGGSDKTRFFLSGTYFDQTGIVIGSDFKRYSMRLNLDHNVNDKLKLSGGVSFSRSISTRPRNDNNIYGVVSTAFLLGSHIPAYNTNGTYGRDPNASIENPLANAYELTNDVRDSRLLINASGEYQILPGLSYRLQVGIDYLNLKEQLFIPSTHVQGAGVRGDASEGYTQDLNWIIENILNYRKSFGDHTISATAVASYQESKFESLFGQTQNFPGNDIRRLSGGSVRVQSTSGVSEWGLIGYIGRVNYSYQDKYYLQASLRRDGASRFGADKRWGTFPAVSAAWRPTEESFIGKGSVVSDVKIRGSYGLAGNASFGDFASLPLVGGGANFAQAAGLAPTQLGNPNLSWEQSEQTDIGLELGLFKNRLNITAEYYIRKTKDLLLNRPLVGSSGFASIAENIGELESKGLELSISSTNFRTKDFTWTTNFNITFPQNRVLKLAGTPFAAGFASWVEEGQDVGAFRGYVVKGIFKDAAAVAAAPVHSSATRAGDVQFEDLNGDNIINANDQRIIGSAVPKYFGGLTNTFSFKGFELNVFVQFVQGNSIYNNTRSFAEGMNSVFGQIATTQNRWTTTKTDATMPRAVWGDPSNNRRVSNRWLEDGSFVRLKNISFSYNLPTSIVEKIKLSGLKFYIQVENLYTWTNYSGLDPEVSTFSVSNTAPGTDFLTFPQARTLTFGLNVNF